jgi:hypothetical protein
MNLVTLAFHRQIVAVQKLTLIEVLALHQALYGSRVVAVPNVEIAILHHQGIFQ